MSVIAPEQLLGTLDVEGLPETPKDVPRPIPVSYRQTLPGAQDSDTGVTDSQVKTMARWASQNLDLTLTWAEAVTEMRKRFVVGRQSDFNIADRIIKDGYKANAGEPLTEDQARMVNTIIQALQAPDKQGPEREQFQHWDLGIRQNIAKASPAIRHQFTTGFVGVWTQGSLTVIMDRFTAMFGRPKPKAGLGDILTPSGEAVPAQTKGNEPY